MATRVDVKGYEAFKAEAAKYDADTRVFAMFCGSKDETGNSWCSDCVKTAPTVLEVIGEKGEEGDIFIYCDVGDRTFWRNQQNEFRVDPALKIKGVPTLMLLGTPQRLVEMECGDKGKVELLFED